MKGLKVESQYLGEKERLLEEKFVNTLEKVINIRKDIEHGTKQSITGKEIDTILEESEKYLKRIKRLDLPPQRRDSREAYWSHVGGGSPR